MSSIDIHPRRATNVGDRVPTWRSPLADLEGQPALGHFGPNWFAAVMGTGIVANAAATLPASSSLLITGARAVWVFDALLLGVIASLTATHWIRHPVEARAHWGSPTMAPFYGAPAMALMTVGAGSLLLGGPVIGELQAVRLGAVLWTLGTALGLWTAVAVPFQLFTAHVVAPDSAFGGWLMPVVPPMVSAATGPLLLAHLPPGQWRLNLLLACLMMFGLALVASLVTITLIWSRLAHHKIGPAAMVPTLWIVLGPLGQSVTAAHTVGAAAPAVLPAPYGVGVQTLGVALGAPVLGFAMLWLAIAAVITAQTARQGLPFSLTWWSFTFPVGTVVTGTSGLAIATGSDALAVGAIAGFAGLTGAWALVALRTVRGAYRGTLLRGPVPGGR